MILMDAHLKKKIVRNMIAIMFAVIIWLLLVAFALTMPIMAAVYLSEGDIKKFFVVWICFFFVALFVSEKSWDFLSRHEVVW
jgi:hypothetical protein